MLKDQLLALQSATIPKLIEQKIINAEIATTPFDEKNNLFINPEIQDDIGYTAIDDTNYLISLVNYLPNINVDMIKWWTWWQAKGKENFRIFNPSANINIKYPKEYKDYFTRKVMPGYEHNLIIPTTKTGLFKKTERILLTDHFNFRFDKNCLLKFNYPHMICGYVGKKTGKDFHSTFCHIFMPTDYGLKVITRYWLGSMLDKPDTKISNEVIAQNIALNLYKKFQNLAQSLPLAYDQFKK